MKTICVECKKIFPLKNAILIFVGIGIGWGNSVAPTCSKECAKKFDKKIAKANE